jgi:hypothetical protein
VIRTFEIPEVDRYGEREYAAYRPPPFLGNGPVTPDATPKIYLSVKRLG